MELPLLISLVRRQSEDPIRTILEALCLIEGQELEWRAFVRLKLLLIGIHIAGRLELLEASNVLPDESLEVCRPIRKGRGSAREDFASCRLMHVVAQFGVWAAVRIILRNKVVVLRIVDLEVIITSGLVIAKGARDAEVLRPSIEDDLDGLALRVTEIYCANKQRIVQVFQRDLQ